MACFHPLRATRLRSGRISFAGTALGEHLELPCGKCIGCRIDRSKAWAVRCVHEASMHLHPDGTSNNSFITLTYDDEWLPRRPTTLVPDHLQSFLKRLRARVAYHSGKQIRFYACGEYGDENWRPHYHALIFGYDFPDRQLWKVRGGVRSYRSAELEDLWSMGFCTVGDVTVESAAYCARYVMKKVGGEQSEFYYSELDPYTGELIPILPEFSRMSLKPGIGALWFAQYGADIFPDDFVVVKGKRLRVPDYYDTLFDREVRGPFPDGKSAISQVKSKRKARAEARADNSTERLLARERVLKAKVSKLKREV